MLNPLKKFRQGVRWAKWGLIFIFSTRKVPYTNRKKQRSPLTLRFSWEETTESQRNQVAKWITMTIVLRWSGTYWHTVVLEVTKTVTRIRTWRGEKQGLFQSEESVVPSSPRGRQESRTVKRTCLRDTVTQSQHHYHRDQKHRTERSTPYRWDTHSTPTPKFPGS